MNLSWLFLGHGAAPTQNYTSSVVSHRRKPIQGQLLACLDYGWALTVTVVKVTLRRWTTAERVGICTLHLTINEVEQRNT